MTVLKLPSILQAGEIVDSSPWELPSDPGLDKLKNVAQQMRFCSERYGFQSEDEIMHAWNMLRNPDGVPSAIMQRLDTVLLSYEVFSTSRINAGYTLLAENTKGNAGTLLSDAQKIAANSKNQKGAKKDAAKGKAAKGKSAGKKDKKAPGAATVKKCPPKKVFDPDCKKFSTEPFDKEFWDGLNTKLGTQIDFEFINSYEKTISKANVPGEGSGVTVGTGIDLQSIDEALLTGKKKNRANEAIPALDKELADKIRPYCGLKGADACEAIKDKSLELTPDEVKKLDEWATTRHVKDAQNEWGFYRDQKGTPVARTGIKEQFDELDPNRQTALYSRYHHQGDFDYPKTYLEKARKGEWEAAKNLYPTKTPRLKAEKGLLDKALESNKAKKAPAGDKK